MISPTVLDGKTNVNVSGNATASANPSNFAIQGSAADVANYARQGDNLIVQMKDGTVHTIRNFGTQGWDFNNLVFTDGDTSSLVDLSKAVSATGDGIAESLVVTQTIDTSLSNTALLGILGAAAAVGVALAAGGGGGSGKTAVTPADPKDPTESTDKTPPLAPSMLSMSEDTGLSAIDGITSDNRLVFTGKAEANSTVKLFILGAPIGSTKADANGDWSFDFSDTLLPDGNYTLTATATDAAKNTSPVSAEYAFRVDTTIAAPSALSATDSHGVPITDNVTNLGELVFYGTAEANASVELFLNETSIGTVKADSNGNWSFDHSGTTLSHGAYELQAIATDIAGNVSLDSSYTFEVIQPLFGVTIIGNGSGGGTIFFIFDEGIDPASFDESDIIVANGYFNPGTLTQDSINPKMWTATVTPDLGVSNTNVAVTLVKGSVIALSGATNSEGKNETTLDALFGSASLLVGDITGWDTSHAVSASGTFVSNSTFNQDIGAWDVSNITDMSGMFASASTFNQDIGNWNVSSVTNMSGMLTAAPAFNQNISGWDVSSVTNMDSMFKYSSAFNSAIGTWDVSSVTNMDTMLELTSAFDQNLGGWDISSLTSATNMFANSGMSVANMDTTLRGWAKLDTAAGETAIQNNVTWGIATYTDATAAQYLRDHYNWTITGSVQAGVLVGDNATGDTIGNLFDENPQIIHGLGGNDTIFGSKANDWIAGGAGNDTLTGGLGSDTFHYGFADAGNDLIMDFEAGSGKDIIHLSDLLIGYEHGISNLADFITAEDDGIGKTRLTIDHDGAGADTTLVTITLASVDYSGTVVNDLIASGNIILA